MSMKVIALAISMVLAATSMSAGEDLTMKFISQGVTYHQGLIRDISAEFVCETAMLGEDHKGPEDMRRLKSRCTWMKKGDKEYMKRVQSTATGKALRISEAAWDGKKGTTWRGKDDSAPGTGTISDRIPPMLSGALTPKRLGFQIEPYPIAKAIALGSWEIVDDITEADGSRVAVIRGGPPGGTGSPYKVWLNVSKGFMPVKIEFYRGKEDDNLWVTYDTTALKQVGEDSWVPTSGVLRSPLGTSIKLTVESIAINQDMPDSKFYLQWKPGAEVWDRILQTRTRIPQGAAEEGVSTAR